MNRKAYILILMYLGWPLNLVHRAWNNATIHFISPFPYERQELSVQWYVYGILSIVSWLSIFWGIWIYITGNYKGDRDFKTVLAAYFIILAIDLPHYLLWFRRCEGVLFIEGIIILGAAFLTTWRAYKKNIKACNHK